MHRKRKCPFLGQKQGFVKVAKTKPKDNSSVREKVALRKRALADLAALGVDRPVVLESHGGNGVLFNRCYEHLPVGVVFEKDAAKCERLALQRPSWRVYEADCENALAEGIAGDLAFDLFDCDPYGGSWGTLQSYFSSRRAFADRMIVVVNDGMRQALSMGAAWSIKVLEPYVQQFGNDAIYGQYGEIGGLMLADIVRQAGYTVKRYGWHYTGKKSYLLHFLAELERE